MSLSRSPSFCSGSTAFWRSVALALATRRSAAPSFWLIMRLEMRTRLLLPPMVKISVPPTLLAMTTAVAPAVCAFSTLVTKSQVPRSISATLPLTVAAIAVQPSAGEAAATEPVTPVLLSAGPNTAGKAP